MKRFLIFILFSSFLFAQDSNYYLEKLNDQVSGIEDMEADIWVRSRMPGLTVPDRSGRLFFKRPDKVHIEGSGFMMIPKEALMLDMSAFVEDSTTSIEIINPGSGEKGKDIQAVVTKIIENRILKSDVYIDTTRWVIHSMKVDEGSNFQATIEFSYKRINDKVRLPNEVTMTIISERSMNRRVKHPRSRRKPADNADNKGYITLKFSNHKINSGLSDNLFENDK